VGGAKKMRGAIEKAGGGAKKMRGAVREALA
jgi:hypothetical protein